MRRKWDATTITGTLAVLFGVAWLLSALHAIHVSVEGVVAVGLMLLGASLIVTGRTDWSLSRRSWPVLLGVTLMALLVATSTTFGVGPALRNLSFGSRDVTVNRSGQQISGGFGTLTVDASRLAGGGRVAVSNLTGDVQVTLPPGVAVRLDARVLAGEICLLGQNVGRGVAASTHQYVVPPAAPPQSPVLDIEVHEVFGQIRVGGPGCTSR